MKTFTPKDPETLMSFDAVLAEYNQINGINTVFTDDYMIEWDIYVGTERTADSYDVYTIQHNGDGIVLQDNVYMYEPDAYAIFNAINESNCYDKCVVYIEDFESTTYDLENYMREELNTNFINWLDENKLND